MFLIGYSYYIYTPNIPEHRGVEKPAKSRYKPHALAETAPGQLISSDITYRPTPVMGIYFPN